MKTFFAVLALAVAASAAPLQFIPLTYGASSFPITTRFTSNSIHYPVGSSFSHLPAGLHYPFNTRLTSSFVQPVAPVSGTTIIGGKGAATTFNTVPITYSGLPTFTSIQAVQPEIVAKTPGATQIA